MGKKKKKQPDLTGKKVRVVKCNTLNCDKLGSENQRCVCAFIKKIVTLSNKIEGVFGTTYTINESETPKRVTAEEVEIIPEI